MANLCRDRDAIDVLLEKNHRSPYRPEELRFAPVACDGPPCSHIFSPVQDWFIPSSLEGRTLNLHGVSTPSVGSHFDCNVAVFSFSPSPQPARVRGDFHPYQAAVLHTETQVRIDKTHIKHVERFELLGLTARGEQLLFHPTCWIEVISSWVEEVEEEEPATAASLNPAS